MTSSKVRNRKQFLDTWKGGSAKSQIPYVYIDNEKRHTSARYTWFQFKSLWSHTAPTLFGIFTIGAVMTWMLTVCMVTVVSDQRHSLTMQFDKIQRTLTAIDFNPEFTPFPTKTAETITFAWGRCSNRSSIRQYPTIDFTYDNKADKGGLIMEKSLVFKREINPNDSLRFEDYREAALKFKGRDKPFDNEVLFDEPQDCLPPNWTRLRFPTCNKIHELTFERIRDSRQNQPYNVKKISAGTYRQTYRFDQPEGDSFVVKPIFMRNAPFFMMSQLRDLPKEILIMERLTSSPRIPDAYGYCGTTVVSELLPVEVTHAIQPHSKGTANQTKLDELDVNPANNLTPVEKLQIALEAAEALADIHGFKDGVIIHGDMHIDQLLASPEGKLKLNDFNLATILEWSDSKHDYCRRERGPWPELFRAPEEIDGKPFDEKIDVFSFGNSLYSLITGLRPFYNTNGVEDIVKKISKRERAFIDPRYRSRSYIEIKLIEIMERCWEHDPVFRPDIFAVVNFLHDVQANSTMEKEAA